MTDVRALQGGDDVFPGLPYQYTCLSDFGIPSLQDIQQLPVHKVSDMDTAVLFSRIVPHDFAHSPSGRADGFPGYTGAPVSGCVPVLYRQAHRKDCGHPHRLPAVGILLLSVLQHRIRYLDVLFPAEYDGNGRNAVDALLRAAEDTVSGTGGTAGREMAGIRRDQLFIPHMGCHIVDLPGFAAGHHNADIPGGIHRYLCHLAGLYRLYPYICRNMLHLRSHIPQRQESYGRGHAENAAGVLRGSETGAGGSAWTAARYDESSECDTEPLRAE